MVQKEKKKRSLANWLTFRRKIFVIVLGSIIAAFSLFFTNNMTRQLREREKYEVELWVKAWEMEANPFIAPSPLVSFIIQNNNTNNTIPFVIATGQLEILGSNAIDEQIINHPDKLRKLLFSYAKKGHDIPIRAADGSRYFIYYGESNLLKMLTYFPFIQILVIVIFAAFGYITFRSSKDDEQNRVWIGLAKETAHQLGTPTSSLLGWIEYLRDQPVDQNVVDEMSNDLARLMKVVDRFSKIGSETVLSPANVNEVVGSSVMYFKSRIPKNVTLNYNGFAIAPIQAMINAPLFEWVVENLLKNALDAIQGKGSIDVNITSDDEWVNIDVSDTGKGIAKANFKRIFEPGYTTKTRGWGLGLSLSKRIAEDNHKGKIYVVDSEPGKGTTIRISLRKIYS